jgi:Effector Associated Constant Component 1
MDEAPLNLTLTPQSDRYDENDDRWLEQVAELRRELHDEAGVALVPVPAEAGKKGATADLIVALGSAGAFTATVDMLRAWLARDKTRKIRCRFADRNGKQQEIVVVAENADAEALTPVLNAIAKRIEAT